MGRFGSIVGSALISADRRIFMRNEEKNHTEKVSVTEVTHEAAESFWSQGLKLQHHDNHFFEGFMMDKTLYKTLFICRLIFFCSRECREKKFQLLSAPVCTVSLLLVTLLNKTFLKKCWTSQFLYIRRTRILAISYAVFLYVQKRNFNLNLLEPLKD